MTTPPGEQEEAERRREARSRLGVPSIWEEPHFRGQPGGPERTGPPFPPSRSRPAALIIVALVAIAGALLAILGAFFRGGGGWGILLLVVVAPTYEEVAKPLGILLMCESRSRWVFARWQIVAAAVIGAAVFSSIENLFYTHVFHPSGGPEFVRFRWTVCMALHCAASTITGIGLAREWRRSAAEHRHFETEKVFPFYIGAIALHGAYNGIVTILELTHVFSF